MSIKLNQTLIIIFIVSIKTYQFTYNKTIQLPFKTINVTSIHISNSQTSNLLTFNTNSGINQSIITLTNPNFNQTISQINIINQKHNPQFIDLIAIVNYQSHITTYDLTNGTFNLNIINSITFFQNQNLIIFIDFLKCAQLTRINLKTMQKQQNTINNTICAQQNNPKNIIDLQNGHLALSSNNILYIINNQTLQLQQTIQNNQNQIYQLSSYKSNNQTSLLICSIWQCKIYQQNYHKYTQIGHFGTFNTKIKIINLNQSKIFYKNRLYKINNLYNNILHTQFQINPTLTTKIITQFQNSLKYASFHEKNNKISLTISQYNPQTFQSTTIKSTPAPFLQSLNNYQYKSSIINNTIIIFQININPTTYNVYKYNISTQQFQSIKQSNQQISNCTFESLISSSIMLCICSNHQQQQQLQQQSQQYVEIRAYQISNFSILSSYKIPKPNNMFIQISSTQKWNNQFIVIIANASYNQATLLFKFQNQSIILIKQLYLQILQILYFSISQYIIYFNYFTQQLSIYSILQQKTINTIKIPYIVHIYQKSNYIIIQNGTQQIQNTILDLSKNQSQWFITKIFNHFSKSQLNPSTNTIIFPQIGHYIITKNTTTYSNPSKIIYNINKTLIQQYKEFNCTHHNTITNQLYLPPSEKQTCGFIFITDIEFIYKFNQCQPTKPLSKTTFITPTTNSLFTPKIFISPDHSYIILTSSNKNLSRIQIFTSSSLTLTYQNDIPTTSQKQIPQITNIFLNPNKNIHITNVQGLITQPITSTQSSSKYNLTNIKLINYKQNGCILFYGENQSLNISSIIFKQNLITNQYLLLNINPTQKPNLISLNQQCNKFIIYIPTTNTIKFYSIINNTIQLTSQYKHQQQHQQLLKQIHIINQNLFIASNTQSLTIKSKKQHQFVTIAIQQNLYSINPHSNLIAIAQKQQTITIYDINKQQIITTLNLSNLYLSKPSIIISITFSSNNSLFILTNLSNLHILTTIPCKSTFINKNSICTCPTNSILINETCICQNGYITQNTCISCKFPCKSCEQNGKCINYSPIFIMIITITGFITILIIFFVIKYIKKRKNIKKQKLIKLTLQQQSVISDDQQ